MSLSKVSLFPTSLYQAPKEADPAKATSTPDSPEVPKNTEGENPAPKDNYSETPKKGKGPFERISKDLKDPFVVGGLKVAPLDSSPHPQKPKKRGSTPNSSDLLDPFFNRNLKVTPSESTPNPQKPKKSGSDSLSPDLKDPFTHRVPKETL